MIARCEKVETVPEGEERDRLYNEVAETFGPALARLARAYEPDSDKCRDLLQEIQIALWRSLLGFDGRCSLRTWVYRVAHNTAISQVSRRRANAPALVALDELETSPDTSDRASIVDKERAMDRLFALIQTLKPTDRQVILLYLEGMDAASIGEITGLTQGNVATKIHRIKNVLTRRFHERGLHDE
jgi:RNA polymerase sigma-70 factor (ECF subfamily)